VDGGGVLEVRFLDFDNAEAKRFDGQCCEEVGGWWFTASDECDTCDHSFIVCIGNQTE
jgi:hypothetical protein